MHGKKLLINSYIMSSLSFLVEAYPCHIPFKIIKKTKELIADFFWSSKTWRISQKNLALKKSHGGLELPDIDTFIRCKLLKWIFRIHYSPISQWNAYGKFCISHQDTRFNVVNFLLNHGGYRHVVMQRFTWSFGS